MSEPVEIQMARVQEQLKAVVSSLATDRLDRRDRDVTINKMANSMESMDHRLGVVEAQMTANAPTISEFMVVKQRVIGAGMMGKWAWALGAATITLIYTSREAIKSFFLSN